MTEANSEAALNSENIIKATVACIVSGHQNKRNLKICIFSGIHSQF